MTLESSRIFNDLIPMQKFKDKSESLFLQLENVGFTFPGKKHLLTNVTLALDRKAIYALMGSNGSGKTTLFNLISGFHKPQSGSIVFKGRNISGAPPYRINRAGVGRSFQDLRLIGKLTVRENIFLSMPNNLTDSCVRALLPATVFRKHLKWMESRVDKVIADYFLWDVQDSFANEISFGQQKLLNLACCVANGADLLLLDEPVAGISTLYKERVGVLLTQLRDRGKSIFIIEHNLEFISKTADCFLFLNDGQLLQYGSLQDFKESSVAA